MGPLLQPCDRVSSLGVIEHDLLGISVIPSASQVDIVPEKVIDSSFNHLEGVGGGGEGGGKDCTLEAVHTLTAEPSNCIGIDTR